MKSILTDICQNFLVFLSHKRKCRSKTQKAASQLSVGHEHPASNGFKHNSKKLFYKKLGNALLTKIFGQFLIKAQTDFGVTDSQRSTST